MVIKIIILLISCLDIYIVPMIIIGLPIIICKNIWVNLRKLLYSLSVHNCNLVKMMQGDVRIFKTLVIDSKEGFK